MLPKARTNSTALISGSFAPIHKGSFYTIQFASKFADNIIIAINNSTENKIELAISLRTKWLKDCFPQAEIINFESIEHLQFQLQAKTPDKLDFVIGSDKFDQELANILNSCFIPIDPERSIINISGTDIRKNPLHYWNYICQPAQTHYLKRICIFGPESTGKSTLTKNLANYFKTIAVPEWARTMLSSRNDELSEDMLVLFAKGHAALEDTLAKEANKFLFCDTDTITTIIWSEWLYESRCADAIKELANERKYDLYLLTDIDVPWVRDPQRYLPNERQEFYNRCLLELDKRNLPYVKIAGDWSSRLQLAIDSIKEKFEKFNESLN